MRSCICDEKRQDGWNGGSSYNVELVAFNPGDDRSDVDGGPAGNVVASLSGSDATTAYQTRDFVFGPDAVDDAGELGLDLGIRFNGATSSANWDNVEVSASGLGGGGNDFSDWSAGYAVGGLTGFGDDPDGDGLGNGTEAWFGTDPMQKSAGLVGVSTDGFTSAFTHPQNETPPDDVSGSYEWSTNLGDWYVGDGVDGPPGGVTVTIVSNTVGTATTVTTSASGELGELFLRVGTSARW